MRCPPDQVRGRWLFRPTSALRLDRLDHLKTFELGMVEIERPVLSGVAMREPERLGPGPCLEIRLAAPQRVRGVQHVVVALWSAQQVEGDEAIHLAQMRVARGPDLFEGCFRAEGDLEAIHGDEHCAPKLSTPLPHYAGEVEARSAEGEGGAVARPSPASQGLRDLSREERERCTTQWPPASPSQFRARPGTGKSLRKTSAMP